jgi:hypothetical protein
MPARNIGLSSGPPQKEFPHMIEFDGVNEVGPLDLVFLMESSRLCRLDRLVEESCIAYVMLLSTEKN